jgi:accessory gene regulator B
MKPADKAAGYLARELSLSEAQAEVVRYGLLSLAATLLNLAAIAAVSALLGVLREALVTACVMMAFRKVSGGAHCTTLHGCIITGTLVITAISLAARSLASWLGGSLTVLLAPLLVVLAAAWLYAPADVPQKPISSPAQRLVLRTLSLCLILAWGSAGLYLWSKQYFTLVYYYSCANLGLLWQALMLTPAGYRLMVRISPIFGRRPA